MEAVSGVASATQLLAYSHSTFQVLIKLYKQVRDGPASLKHQQSSVLVLLSVVDGLQRRPAPTHILATLLELSTLATEALNLIVQSQKRGFLGLSWSAVRHEQLLKEVFASLKDKREVLHLAISVESMSTNRFSDDPQREDESKVSTAHRKMRLREWKFWKSIKHTDTGTNNSNIIGNGTKPDSGVTRIQTNIGGSSGFNYIGNVQDFSEAQHHPQRKAQQRSPEADQPPRRPQRVTETSHFTEYYMPHANPALPADIRVDEFPAQIPPIPQRHPSRGRANEFKERPGQMITERSHQWSIPDTSSNPSSPSEADSPSSSSSSDK
ncbi:hypothetical protein K458DRAFT_433585 [Lentithecium fluviatile CBS 122367]|uniref:Uncharacterized protein n=1 Tax=Lentithecium fluviatile CBS 122367 TaxID=1168545 RepID=A0A6G1ITA7_9PLEO|nr:hypothetical protein K458DRAFT_433585 [Lentithecium fluviatile CBS 122367]